MATKPLPSQEALRQLLRYEPETGKLFWLPRSGNRYAPQWNSRSAGKEAFTSEDRYGYRRGRIDGVLYLAHRVIWKWVHGCDPNVIDHVNGNTGDNRIANLRNATAADNSRNYRKPQGSSAYRGVCWVKRDRRWAARISDGSYGKKSLGNFVDEVEAARAYDSAARQLHGEFAILNFPAGFSK